MANRLPNAGFLDLTAGWTVSSPLTLTIDETDRGAPGRAVLRAAGTASGDAQTLTVQPATDLRAAAVAGETIEALVHVAAAVAGVAIAPSVRLVFRAADGSEISAVTLTVAPAALTTHGEARAGLADTFRRAWTRAVAPATTATATIEISATANTGQAVEILVLKPLIDGVPTGRSTPLAWDPGVHAVEDLQLPVWPGILRPFQAEGGPDPKPGRIEFETEQGRPASRRTEIDPVRRFNGTMRCDAVQRAALEAFARTAGDFWMVEPDSERLCVASFAADGAPRMTESRGPTAMVSVGLWLETA